jgi:hypothetical protein
VGATLLINSNDITASVSAKGSFTNTIAGLATNSLHTIVLQAVDAAGNVATRKVSVFVASVDTNLYPAGNADMVGIGIENGTLNQDFRSKTTNGYTIAASSRRISLAPVAFSPGATVLVSVNGGDFKEVNLMEGYDILLNPGANTIVVRVRSQDGTTQRDYYFATDGGVPEYTVTPSVEGVGGLVLPVEPQTVKSNGTVSFEVFPGRGFLRREAVGGTAPSGSWSNNIWTTGPIVGDCSVVLGFEGGGVVAMGTQAMSFAATYRDVTNPPVQTVAMGNTGIGTFHWTNQVAYSSGGEGWLSMLPVSGALAVGASRDLTVAVDVAGLNAGTYTATVTVAAADATNTPQTIRIGLTVDKAPQAINFANPGKQIITNVTPLVAKAEPSGLPVAFFPVSGPVELSSSLSPASATYTGGGQVTIVAGQAGNSNWLAAADVTNSWRIGGLITNVTPEVANVGGRRQVVIRGIDLGTGGNITNVTLAGVEATISTQTVDSVTVMANAATGGVVGAVTVVSGTGGVMVMSNAFTYLWFEAPELLDPVDITASNLVARWVPPFHAASCELDVGIDTNFTTYLPGYKGLGVALAQSYPVSGLQEDTWYAIRVFALNTNGYSLPSRTVWVPAGVNTPYETHPPPGGLVSSGAIMEQSLTNMFFGVRLAYSVESSDTNVVAASITADNQLRLEPRFPGKATITVHATNPEIGYTATYVFVVEVAGVPTLISNGFRTRERWNPRFEQLLKVGNGSGLDAIGIRFLFTNLMAGITVENRTGTAWDGRPMIEQEFNFSAGMTQELSIVYLCTGAYRVDQYPPAIEMQYILPAWHAPLPGAGTSVSAWMMADGSGRFVLDFLSEPGGVYAIEYVHDLSESNWIEVPLRLKAGANRTQWIDSGPPATLPVKAGKRFYRVKQLVP